MATKFIRIFVYFLFIPISVYSSGRVLVIDTGTPRFMGTKMLCDDGHENFTNSAEYDTHKHSTNIIGLISEAKGDYCIVSYKAFDSTPDQLEYTKAIVSASYKRFDIVNLSIDGRGFNLLERNAIERMLKKGTHVVVAAGNQAQSLDRLCNIYPACYVKIFKKYPNFYVIGAKDLWQSNKGTPITDWDFGKNQGKPLLSGTSQATANFTKKLVEKLFK